MLELPPPDPLLELPPDSEFAEPPEFCVEFGPFAAPGLVFAELVPLEPPAALEFFLFLLAFDVGRELLSETATKKNKCSSCLYLYYLDYFNVRIEKPANQMVDYRVAWHH